MHVLEAHAFVQSLGLGIAGAAPREGHLAHDDKAMPFLALLSPQATTLVAVSLPRMQGCKHAHADASLQVPINQYIHLRLPSQGLDVIHKCPF